MAAVNRRLTRFPISPDLVGPWDALQQELPQAKLSSGATIAKQQAINLNNLLESLGGDLADLKTRLETLESAVAEQAAQTSGSTITLLAEEPLGTKNGSNVLFTLSASPSLLILILNGVVLTPEGEDYTLVGSQIQYQSGKTPASTDDHFAWGFILS